MASKFKSCINVRSVLQGSCFHATKFHQILKLDSTSSSYFLFEVDLELYLCILDFLDRRHINMAMMPITRNTALHTLITTVSAGPTEIKFGVGPEHVYG